MTSIMPSYGKEKLGRKIEIAFVNNKHKYAFYEGRITGVRTSPKRYKTTIKKSGKRVHETEYDLSDHYVDFHDDDEDDGWYDLGEMEEKGRLRWPDSSSGDEADGGDTMQPDAASSHNVQPDNESSSTVKPDVSSSHDTKPVAAPSSRSVQPDTASSDSDRQNTKRKKVPDKPSSSAKKVKTEPTPTKLPVKKEPKGASKKVKLESNVSASKASKPETVRSKPASPKKVDAEKAKVGRILSEPIPTSLTQIIHYMDRLEPSKNYFKRQADTRNGKKMEGMQKGNAKHCDTSNKLSFL